MVLLNGTAIKAIKVMANVSHVAQLISQMPQPKMFAMMISSDIITMSGRIQQLAININKLLDGYTNLPFDFVNNQIDSIMNSVNNTLYNVDNYANHLFSDIGYIGSLYSNGTGSVKKVVGTQVDMFGTTTDKITYTSQNVLLLSNSNSHDKIELLGDINLHIGESIEDARNGESPLSGVVDALNTVDDAMQKGKRVITDTTGKVRETANGVASNISGLLKVIKNNVDKFSKCVDDAFGVNALKSAKIYSELGSLATVDIGGNDEFGNLATTAVTESAKTAQSIISNFSIGKFVSGCAGIAANTVLVQTGLNKLKPISIEKALSNINGIERKILDSPINLDDLVQYDDEYFRKFKERYDEELKNQRNEIKRKIADKKKKSFLANEQIINKRAEINAIKNLKNSLTDEEKANIKTAIKEIRKERRNARKARQANNLKTVVLNELKKFADDMKRLSKNVVTKWEGMMKTYKQSVAEVKEFFTSGGLGDVSIEMICDDINTSFDNLMKNVTDLAVQIVQASLNVKMPRAIGMCGPNIVQHIIQFLQDLKVIARFIRDIILDIMNIIAGFKKLVDIIFSGLKSLVNMLNELLEMFGVNRMKRKIENTIENLRSTYIDAEMDNLENYLMPIYFNQTTEYDNVMEEFDYLFESTNMASINTHRQRIFDKLYGRYSKKCNEFMEDYFKSNGDLFDYIVNDEYDDDFETDYFDAMNDLENVIVAYRSPIFEKDSEGNIKNKDDDGNRIDPKLIGWIYYYPNLWHHGWTAFAPWDKLELYRKKGISRLERRSRKIYYASRNRNKTGGVYMLRNSKIKFEVGTKIVKGVETDKYVRELSSFDAFYWYTVYTNDLVEIDYFGQNENPGVIYKAVVEGDKGTVVTVDLGDGTQQKLFVKNSELNGGFIKSGDYIKYNGNKYKVIFNE